MHIRAGVHSTHKNESRKPYQINTLSTLGMRAIGKWRNAALKLSAVLNQGKTVSKIAWAKGWLKHPVKLLTAIWK